jgi:pimeloyl-ACP methyl ester carboxylesterase
MRSLRIETHRGTFEALAWGDDDAPIALLLHGFPDTPRSWRWVAERLAARGLRVVAPYLRGYFPSPIEGAFDVDALADDLAAQIEALSRSVRATLVGHDWGAAIAYCAAARHARRFDCAVTLAVPHPLAFLRAVRTQRDQARRSAYMALFQAPFVSDAIVARDDFAFIDGLWKRWSPDYALPDEERRALKDCLRASMPAPLQTYRAMVWPPREAFTRIQRARRDRIAVPTLHLQGDRDGCIALSACEGQSPYFSGAFEHRAIARVGHFAQLEAPEIVADAILAWRRTHAQLSA